MQFHVQIIWLQFFILINIRAPKLTIVENRTWKFFVRVNSGGFEILNYFTFRKF